MDPSINEPGRASFLGLATEIRLQIYSYLLIPYNTPDQLQELKNNNHCCAIAHTRKRYVHPHDDCNVDVACHCSSKNLYPAILFTNKQIFNEAVQILYENMEFHVRLPHYVTWRDSPLQNSINALPSYSYKWIHRMVVVGTPGEASELHRDPGKMTWRFPMEQYADAISATFPEMRHVRLHVDFGSSKNGRRTAVESFGYIMGLPQLESVTVDVDGLKVRRSPIGPGNWEVIMSERITQFVMKARTCYDKTEKVNVRRVLEDGSVWESGTG